MFMKTLRGNRRSDKKSEKEFEFIEKLKQENKKLKRDLKVARKLLDRYHVAEEKGLIEEDIITPSKKRQKEKELLEQWQCYTCGKGVLRLIRIGNRYFRKCDKCGKNTKSQLWDPSVKGA